MDKYHCTFLSQIKSNKFEHRTHLAFSMSLSAYPDSDGWEVGFKSNRPLGQRSEGIGVQGSGERRQLRGREGS